MQATQKGLLQNVPKSTLFKRYFTLKVFRILMFMLHLSHKIKQLKQYFVRMHNEIHKLGCAFVLL